MSIALFNGLPRTPLSPSGLVPNHWHFSLRHVPLPPAGLVLYIINPAARYVHVPGRIDLSLSEAPIETKAMVIIGVLLSAFAKQELNRSRPWSWSTNDAALASVMGGKLRALGVTDGLDVVGVASDEENRIADEDWTQFLDRLRGLATRTSGTGRS